VLLLQIFTLPCPPHDEGHDEYLGRDELQELFEFQQLSNYSRPGERQHVSTASKTRLLMISSFIYSALVATIQPLLFVKIGQTDVEIFTPSTTFVM